MPAHRLYNKDQLLDNLYNLAQQLNRRPKLKDLGIKNEIAGESTYRRYFPDKNWSEILALAGIDKEEESKVLYTTDYLIERLVWLMKQINDEIGWAEVNVYRTLPNPQTYNRRFEGGLKEAKQLAKERIE